MNIRKLFSSGVFRKLFSSGVISVVMLFAATPAEAGIPVIDGANLANSILQVLAWGQQAEDMINQFHQLEAQFSQLQTMTTKLDGIRNLGTILNDPTIQSVLPADMRDSTQLLLHPQQLVTSPAAINGILASFGVDTSTIPNAGQVQADTIGRMQQILTSAQTRATQLASLASRVDGTTDAKESLDMVNRNVLEAASINNQMQQTMASVEAAKQAADLKKLADSQAYYSNVKTGASAPLHTYSY